MSTGSYALFPGPSIHQTTLPVDTGTGYALNHQPAAARDMGVIAQELQPLFPETVHDENDQFAVSYDQLTVIAIKGIQEQQVQLEAMSAQIDSLMEKE